MPAETYSPIAESPMSGCLVALEVEAETGRGLALLRCPAEFLGFEGHFPGEPILPAVLQLMAVRLLAETVAGRPLEPAGVERLKFKGMVRPDEEVTVQVVLGLKRNLLRVNFSLERGKTKIATGALLLREAGQDN